MEFQRVKAQLQTRAACLLYGVVAGIVLASFIDAPAVTEHIRNLGTPAAAFVGLFLARRGLLTWRLQLQGTARFDACVKLMRAAINTKSAIETVRSPMSELHEAVAAAEKLGADTPDGDSQFQHIVALSRTNDLLGEARALRDAAIEVEIVVGESARAGADKLLGKVTDLQVMVEAYVEYILEREKFPERPDPDPDFHAEVQRIVGARRGPQADEFVAAVEEAMDDIKRAIGPYIRERAGPLD